MSIFVIANDTFCLSMKQRRRKNKLKTTNAHQALKCMRVFHSQHVSHLISWDEKLMKNKEKNKLNASNGHLCQLNILLHPIRNKNVCKNYYYCYFTQIRASLFFNVNIAYEFKRLRIKLKVVIYLKKKSSSPLIIHNILPHLIFNSFLAHLKIGPGPQFSNGLTQISEKQSNSIHK